MTPEQIRAMEELVHRHYFEPEQKFFIVKDGYFYGPRCCGYTKDPSEAGRYSKAEAERACKGLSAELTIQPIPAPAYGSDHASSWRLFAALTDYSSPMNLSVHKRINHWEVYGGFWNHTSRASTLELAVLDFAARGKGYTNQ